MAVITGRNSVIVSERMKSLGVNHVYQGRMNKLETYENLKLALNITDDQVAFVGDDIIDLPIMRRCSLSVAVADAHEEGADAAYDEMKVALAELGVATKELSDTHAELLQQHAAVAQMNTSSQTVHQNLISICRGPN